jgi:hypothetical protein
MKRVECRTCNPFAIGPHRHLINQNDDATDVHA